MFLVYCNVNQMLHLEHLGKSYFLELLALFGINADMPICRYAYQFIQIVYWPNWFTGWLTGVDLIGWCSRIDLYQAWSDHDLTGWWFQRFFIFNLYLGKWSTIWLYNIFQRGWFNHQPGWCFMACFVANLVGSWFKNPTLHCLTVGFFQDCQLSSWWQCSVVV